MAQAVELNVMRVNTYIIFTIDSKRIGETLDVKCKPHLRIYKSQGSIGFLAKLR